MPATTPDDGPTTQLCCLVSCGKDPSAPPGAYRRSPTHLYDIRVPRSGPDGTLQAAAAPTAPAATLHMSQHPMWVAVAPAGTPPAGDLTLLATEGGCAAPEGSNKGPHGTTEAPRKPGAVAYQVRLSREGPAVACTEAVETASYDLHGEGPCHTAVSPCGVWAAVSHYDSGDVAVFRLGGGGGGGEGEVASPQLLATECGPCTPGEGRQDARHCHSALFLDSSTLAVCDLGADTVQIWRRPGGADGGDSAPLAWVPCSAYQVEGGGAGVRHAAASPCGRHLYVVCELSNELLVLGVAGGAPLALEARLPLLPAGWLASGAEPPFPFYTAPSHAAGIKVAGSHIFITNRGHDSVSVFAIDAKSGLPTTDPAVTFPSGGRLPWDLDVRGVGREYLVVVANQYGDTVQDEGRVAVHAFDPEAGAARQLCVVPCPQALFCKLL